MVDTFLVVQFWCYRVTEAVNMRQRVWLVLDGGHNTAKYVKVAISAPKADALSVELSGQMLILQY